MSVTETGNGIVDIENYSSAALTVTNTGQGNMNVMNTNTAATVVTHTGDGNSNIVASGSTALALTYTGTAAFNYPHLSVIPSPDTCGSSVGKSCSPVGPAGWFYRCCSAAGYCGPTDSANQASYCGTGCQSTHGDCSTQSVPTLPSPTNAAVSSTGECGPIVNLVCPSPDCCSQSNYCGTGTSYCSSANCQSGWGAACT